MTSVRAYRWIIWIAFVTSMTIILADNTAAELDDIETPPAAYTERGADTCLKCHDEDDEFPVLSIFETKHAMPSDERTPFAGLQCESCHGPGAAHAKNVRPDQRQAPIIGFKRESTFEPNVQNDMCLQCHEDYSRASWQGSVHEQSDVMCAQCHTVHARHDPILQAHEEADVCYDCHTKERSELMRASVHPVRAGSIFCSSCHDVHDSWTEGLLVRPTLNETCYECHAEKRGPFLWEHAPVPEDCSICHTPHGSNHESLLTKRAPLLCQQCHSQAGHPSFAWDGDGLAEGPDIISRQFLLGKSCLNCHSQVHGSNHPSGIKLMR